MKTVRPAWIPLIIIKLGVAIPWHLVAATQPTGKQQPNKSVIFLRIEGDENNKIKRLSQSTMGCAVFHLQISGLVNIYYFMAYSADSDEVAYDRS